MINLLQQEWMVEISVEKNILPLNYWNNRILLEDKIFDTTKRNNKTN